MTNKWSIKTIYERESLPMISNPQDQLKVPEKPVTPVSSPEVMSETRDDLLQVCFSTFYSKSPDTDSLFLTRS